jgi:hypothetical protein
MGASFPLTFDATFAPQPSWWIDGQPIERATSESATNRTLTLSFRVTTADLDAYLRPLKPDEGKVDTVGTDDGGYRSIDRAGGDNTYLLTPPTRRQPLRQEATYHVARYEESLISQTTDEWDVEIEFVRARDRTDTATVDQPATGAAFDWTFDQAFTRRTPATWGFTTPNGELSSDRVSADVLGTGDGGVRRFDVEARLTFVQARAFETSYARLGGGRVRDIPDAPNVAVDDTDDDAVTVDINSPADAAVASGAYVVSEWDSERLTDAYQRVSMTVAAKD